MRQNLAELGLGLTSALISILLVSGAILMAFSQGASTLLPPSPTTTTLPGQTVVFASPEPSATATAIIACPMPNGWQSYTILPGDTWEGLAAMSGTSVEELRRNNCDYPGSLISSLILYLPLPTATPTATETVTTTHTARPTKPPSQSKPENTPVPSDTAAPQSCRIPNGWVIYVVQPGDNLFRIALRYNMTYTELAYANCLPSTYIQAGQRIYVPYLVPTATSTHTLRPSDTRPPATRTPTYTSTAVPPSSTATQTPIPPTATSSNTPVPPTATDTDTPVPPTATDTDTPVPPTSTWTPTPG